MRNIIYGRGYNERQRRDRSAMNNGVYNDKLSVLCDVEKRFNRKNVLFKEVDVGAHPKMMMPALGN